MYTEIINYNHKKLALKNMFVALKVGLLLTLICSNIYAFSTPPTKEETAIVIANNTNNHELGKRYLKLGNTYREAQKHNQAIKYLNKGKQTFQSQRNAEEQYWFAVANEFLAYYYRDINQKDKAQQHLDNANTIYRQVITQSDGSGMATEDMNLLQPKKLLQSNTAPQNTDYISKQSSETNLAQLQNLRNVVNSIKARNSKNHKADPSNKLNLDNQSLTAFPSEYVNFETENLSIANNKIEVFPEIILSFNELQELNISNNVVKSFPAINKLKNLKYLDFSGNNVTEINSSIGELNSLEYLNLSNNKQLKNLSKEITKLPNLRILDVRNTALSMQQISDLLTQLPTTNILYSTVQPKAAGEEVNVDDDMSDWDEDWGEEEEEGWDEEW